MTTKRPKTNDEAKTALEALVQRHEDLNRRLEQAQADLSAAQAQEDKLSYPVATGEKDGDAQALTAVVETVASCRAEIHRLQAAIRGAAGREEAARRALVEVEREEARARLKVLMEEASQLCRSIAPRLDELVGSISQVAALEDEVRALARASGITFHSKGPKKACIDLVRDRVSTLAIVLPPLLPIMGRPGGRTVPDAETALQQPWRLEP